ncbi:carboxypeptidase regulatory-like domain-containing protein [Chloracidobacterium sp. MS 40/45]|uniref:carboxypeptidase-like regulatory domain-containing protein n=1 Tax=Chloracidobacterium aggregatum TaxID=2851959 RepID=UPI001B8B42F4|nr:carboxypeptidase-like regulatory domain-containing protein [Chloracidobacterium aggregatum]QUV99568.1 carboxypeptidase regulatory-like domain-containing protein [Chloracidobacterium sp. MS 40/45]
MRIPWGIRPRFGAMCWITGLVVLLGWLGAALPVLGQTTNGRFVITVRDPSGAVVAGASVSVTNEGTKQTITGTTADSGTFTTPLLPVGSYSVTVEADGFTKSVIENLSLNVGQEYGVTATLQVGGTSDVITVSGGEALLQTTNAEVRNTVNARQT